MNGKLYKHNKTGRFYRVLDYLVRNATNKSDGDAMVLYVSQDDGKAFVRDKSEFFDGRFTEVEDHDTPTVSIYPPTLDDVHNRIRDWVASGGNVSDPYVKRQLAHIRKVVEHETGAAHDNKEYTRWGPCFDIRSLWEEVNND